MSDEKEVEEKAEAYARKTVPVIDTEDATVPRWLARHTARNGYLAGHAEAMKELAAREEAARKCGFIWGFQYQEVLEAEDIFDMSPDDAYEHWKRNT